jgi:hypothetical protein
VVQIPGVRQARPAESQPTGSSAADPVTPAM